MNKLFMLISTVAVATAVFAADADSAADADGQKDAAVSEVKKPAKKPDSQMWPACFALANVPRSPDVVGLRLTIPYSTDQEGVTGMDIGLWGKSLYFDGIQLNVLRNNVIDTAAGIQIGLYNSIGSGEMIGLQAGLWNEAFALRGIQFGLVNVVGDTQGLQVGIINRAETMFGYQVGLINVIRDAELQFFPLINIGF